MHILPFSLPLLKPREYNGDKTQQTREIVNKMSESFFDYDLMVRDALKGVVKKILTEVAKSGLPGDHHFYIAFDTTVPGVQIPDHLRERYPEEMTIVIQHRYWGLRIHPDRFEIGLSFHQKPEHLIVPFEALVGFVDPTSQFALQFESHEMDMTQPEDEDNIAEDGDAIASTVLDRAVKNSKKEEIAKASDDKNDDENNNVVTLDAFRK